VTANLRRTVSPFEAAEYPLLIAALEGARRRLGLLLCGYVLMPDHWHAIILPRSPLTISRGMESIKQVARACLLCCGLFAQQILIASRPWIIATKFRS